MGDAPLVVAVDGPAASGKSTLARRLAERLGLRYLDTGLLYRAIGKRLLDRGADLGDAELAADEATRLEPGDLDPVALSGDSVGQAASRVATSRTVREALLPVQRRFANTPPGAVLAGRDVGTVICPAAPVKIFVTASAATRARRRFEELRRRGETPIEAQVLEDMLERDRRDQGREIAPLRIADDAWILDTTELDVDSSLAAALAHIEQRIAATRAGGPKAP
jgi:CMP/dCMP kinase